MRTKSIIFFSVKGAENLQPRVLIFPTVINQNVMNKPN